MKSFDIVAVSENENGVLIVNFAPKYIKEQVIDHLSSKHELKYLNSVNDDELLSLVTENDEASLIGKIFSREMEKLKLKWLERINRDDLPKDRYFRAAWKSDLSIDMDKAREIHMDRIRLKRAKKFNELGVPYKLHPSLEEAVLPVELRNKLKALREIPEKFDLSKASTLDELKTLWPEELK